MQAFYNRKTGGTGVDTSIHTGLRYMAQDLPVRTGSSERGVSERLKLELLYKNPLGEPS